MPRISRFILIAAPQQQVFDVVADYRTLPQIQPQFKGVKVVGDKDYGLGATLELNGSLHGMPIEARMTITGFEPSSLLVSRSKGAVNSESTWRFTTVTGDDGVEKTRAALAVEYEFANVALSLLGKIVHRELEQMTEQSLKKLKQLVEQAGA